VSARPRNPTLPGTSTDRTGSAGIQRRAAAAIRRRWAGLQAEALAIFAGIRILAANDAALPRTIYMLTPDELAAVSTALQQAVERWIANGRDPAHSFWWSTYVEESARLGTAQTVANLTNLSEAYAATRTVQDVVFSEPYRNRVAMAQIKSYDHWTGTAAEVRSELSQIIGRAVVDGKNPRAVRSEIMERLDVSKSRAMSFAQTDITDTLRQAKMAEDDFAQEELGISTGQLWTSAFLPTTRANHGSRHGKVYTTAQVREFYNGPDRYNCHCSVTTCLLDAEGKPILTPKLRAAMGKEKAEWLNTVPLASATPRAGVRGVS
jgi:uncharacterized protein with gpF-like domain